MRLIFKIWVNTRRSFLILMIAIGMTFIASCSPMGHVKSVSIEGSPISYVFTKKSGPTVVFNAGGGGTYKSWKPVFKKVADYTSAVAYTRNSNIKATEHLTGYDDASTLKALLEKIDAPKPYVLVGHSLGGMYVRCFAKLFPEDVAGVILLDSMPKGILQECKKLGIEVIPGNLDGFPNYVQAEFRGIVETDKQLPTPAELGHIPVTIIVATKRNPPDLQPVWFKFQKEYIDQLQDGRLVIAHNSGHNVQFDEPKLVLSEIRFMVNKVSK